MKIGQVVNYYQRGAHSPSEAVVEAIVGSGPSNAKMLNLKIGEKTRATSVKHADDVQDGMEFWILPDRGTLPWDRQKDSEPAPSVEDAPAE